MKKFAEVDAFALIKIGLEHGAIKLHGPHSNSAVDGAEKSAEIDARYLLTLLTRLQEEPK